MKLWSFPISSSLTTPTCFSASFVRTSLAGLFLLATGIHSAGQVPDILKQTFLPQPSGQQTGERQGTAVAIEGAYAVTGSPYADVGNSNAGVVKIYNTSIGTRLYTIPNPKPLVTNDFFGAALAISGNLVAVGAYEANPGAADAGSVYIFDLSKPDPTQPVLTIDNPEPAADDFFGYSVAISGNIVVIGAYQDDTGRPNAGSAYVYDLGSATPAQPIFVLNNPSTTSSQGKFGWSVAVSGTRIIVGAPGNDVTSFADTGMSYLYQITGATISGPVSLNHPTPGAGDAFGSAVGVSGTRVVVGAPTDDTVIANAGSVYFYDVSGAVPFLQNTIANPAGTASGGGACFGTALAISGTNLAVGAPLDNTGAADSGIAYVFNLAANPPSVTGTCQNPTPALNDNFGGAVGVSSNKAVFGAYLDDTAGADCGAAYVFGLSGGTPLVLNQPSPATSDEFSKSVTAWGSRFVVGSPQDDTSGANTGCVTVYLTTGNAPHLNIAHPEPAAGDHFGDGVVLHSGGLAVGAPEKLVGTVRGGVVYIYNIYHDRYPTSPFYTIPNPTPAADEKFGSYLGLYGNLLAVGVPQDDFNAPNAGVVHLYQIGGSTSVPWMTLQNPDPTAQELFGGAVAVWETKVAVGARGENTGATAAGAVYVYDTTSVTPHLPTHAFFHPNPVANAGFGGAVGMVGRWLVVGCNTGGKVYVYDLNAGATSAPAYVLMGQDPDGFGCSVAMSGTEIVVGAYLNTYSSSMYHFNDAGAAYVYSLASPTPTVPLAVLSNPAPGTNDHFGKSVAMDGSLVIVGAIDDSTVASIKGAAYTFGPSAYSLWRFTQGFSWHGDLSDTDHDGMQLLAEYGLVKSASDVSVPPTPTTHAYAEGPRLRIFVTRDPSRNDVTLKVLAGNGVAGPWTTIATSTLGAPFSGPGYVSGDSDTPGLKTVEIRDIVDISTSPSRLLRVEVSR